MWKFRWKVSENSAMLKIRKKIVVKNKNIEFKNLLCDIFILVFENLVKF